MICSLLFLRDTIIKTSVLWTFVLIGGTIGTIILSYLWRREKFPLWSNVAYGMLSGGSLSAICLLAPNYAFRTKQGLKYQAEILKTGNRSTRGSSCRTPYAVVYIEDIEKELAFPCEFEQTISQYKKVELHVAKGLAGFYIVQEKRLIK